LKADEQVDGAASGKVGADLSGRGCIDAVEVSVTLCGFEPAWYLRGGFQGASPEVSRAKVMVDFCLLPVVADVIRTRGIPRPRTLPAAVSFRPSGM
jgi:hypothetical protein